MNVVPAEPFCPRRRREFAWALAQAGATVTAAGYLASACVRLRHPDCNALRSLPGAVGRSLPVDAS
jgi:hypothetical protein